MLAIVHSLLPTLVRRDDGQNLAEYAIALAIIGVAAGMLAVAIGGDVTTLWSNAQPAIQTVVDAEP
jgi:Flp pilus assembly pilin Flp